MRRGIKSHRILKDRAMNRVDDLQCMFMDLQSARKEKRKIDMVVLEEQVHQMLKEWKKELTEPSFPASSFQQGGSLGSFSPDITRLLQLYDEEDDATSGLPAPKPDPDAHNDTEISGFHMNFVVMPVFQEQGFKLLDQYKDSPLEINTTSIHNMGVDYFSFDLPHEYENNCIGGVYDMYGEDGLPQITNFLPNICPPPSAFFGPKCALWDCPRPAQGWWSETPVQWWCPNYCSSLHAVIAQNEGQPGMIPILRPKGIELKDNLLFTALSAKGQGKNVGNPECEGVATTKSPWNAPALTRSVLYRGLRFGLYEPSKNFCEFAFKSNNIFMKIASGAVSGAFATLLTNPMEVLKVRLQMDHNLRRGSIGELQKIAAKEGMMALWKEVGPAIVRAGALTASQMATYDEFKTVLVKWTALEEGFYLHFISSTVAGAVSTLITAPMDMVKTRLMLQRESVRDGAYRNGFHCAYKQTRIRRNPVVWWHQKLTIRFVLPSVS